MSKQKYDTIVGELGSVVVYWDAQVKVYTVVPQWIEERQRENCTYLTHDRADAIESARLMANYVTAMPRISL